MTEEATWFLAHKRKVNLATELLADFEKELKTLEEGQTNG